MMRRRRRGVYDDDDDIRKDVRDDIGGFSFYSKKEKMMIQEKIERETRDVKTT